jgi:hypothetical protein
LTLNFQHKKKNKTGTSCYGLLEHGARGQTFGPMAFHFECSLAIFEAEVGIAVVECLASGPVTGPAAKREDVSGLISTLGLLQFDSTV